jgi:hypothetical protein
MNTNLKLSFITACFLIAFTGCAMLREAVTDAPCSPAGVAALDAAKNAAMKECETATCRNVVESQFDTAARERARRCAGE